MQKMLQWLFVFITLPYFADAQVTEALKVTQLKLDNGFTILLNEDRTMPGVTGAIAVKAGSKYDPKDATGMGHYLEHMLFKGTEDFGTTNYDAEKSLLEEINRLYDKLGQTKDEKAREAIQKQINEKSVEAAKFAIPNEMDRLLKSIGSQAVNAFTSPESIVYHNSFPSHQIEKWLDLYAHRFEKPVFRLFQSELEVVYEEKNRSADNFGSQLFEQYMANFFRKHPYGTQTTIGTTEHLKNPSLTKMYEYYNTYYVPNNMALILSGNFSTSEILPVIKARFGGWQAKEVPKFPEYKEEPFKGREQFTRRLSPIKIGIMGFRTVADNHPDKEALEICNYLLSNEGETGLLDELRLNKKLQIAQSVNMSMQDHGLGGIFFVPKIVGQSLTSAENEVLGALEKLKQGKFDEQLFIAAKNNLQKNFYRNLENPRQRAFYMVESFILSDDWNNFLQYPQRINSLTIEQVKTVAGKYYGTDYLVMFSKMGLPKKDKIKKPAFTPVKGNEGEKSVYTQKFESIPAGKPQAAFVDFDKDFQTLSLAHNTPLYITQNPVNDIFTLTINFKANTFSQPYLPVAASYYQSVGTREITSKEFKKKMNALGCNYTFSAENDEFIISLEGIEANYTQALTMLNQLLQSPEEDKSKLDILISDEKAGRKLEAGDPTSVNELLKEYLIYGESSTYLTRPGLKEMSKLSIAEIIKVMEDARSTRAEVHYVGTKNAAELQSIFSNTAIWRAPVKQDAAPAYTYRKTYDKPVIYFLNRKDARQSHLNFYANGKPMEQRMFSSSKAFNSYFGGDMSSLVFQEIREFRSLAYAARFAVTLPRYTAENYILSGYIGCQGDKTKDALVAMVDLIKRMPEKQDRLDGIKSGLKDVAYASRPGFRSLSSTVSKWKDFGFSQDPFQMFIPYYEQLSFDDITKFYRENVLALPVSIAIVGNKKDIDLKALEAYGTVIILEEKDIVRR
mgnify:CR=1 FL=1